MYMWFQPFQSREVLCAPYCELFVLKPGLNASSAEKHFQQKPIISGMGTGLNICKLWLVSKMGYSDNVL